MENSSSSLNFYEKQLYFNFEGLVQESRNSSVLAMELFLSCINSAICGIQNIVLSVKLNQYGLTLKPSMDKYIKLHPL